MFFFGSQHYLKNPDLSAPVKQSQNDGRRFHYRTTLTEGSQQRQQAHRRQQDVNESYTRGQRAQRQQAHLLAQRNRVEISQELRRYPSTYTSLFEKLSCS